MTTNTAYANTPEKEAELNYSAHAIQRMREMGVTVGEVQSAVDFAVRVQQSRHHNSTLYAGRRVCVAIARQPGARLVTTVMWSDADLCDFLEPDRRPKSTTHNSHRQLLAA